MLTAEVLSQKAGFVDIVVVDEDEEPIPEVCVSINGNKIGTAPLLALPVEEGKKIIQVQGNDVGESCQEATIKKGDITKISFKFFRLREQITQLKTTAIERQYHGTIVVLNTLGENTLVYVDRKDQIKKEADLEDKVSKGRGSLKISNLAVGEYVVRIKLKDKRSGDLKCGEQTCRINVSLKKCETVTIRASKKEIKQTSAPSPCDNRSTGSTTRK